MEEIAGRNAPPLAPNFVTLRQPRDRRLMEARAQAEAQPRAQNRPLDRSSTQEKSENPPLLPPNYVSLRHLREQRLKEKREKENEKGKEKESDNRPRLPPNDVSLRNLQELRLEEEKENKNGSDKGPSLPANHVSLKQLQERRLKEMNEKQREKGKDKESDQGPPLPPNYVSLRQLKELRLKEKEAEEDAEKARLQEIKDQEKMEEPGRIEVEFNKKVRNQARNLQSRKSYKLGSMKWDWIWRPVRHSAASSGGIGAPSSDAMLVPENADASGEFLVALSDQNGNVEMKNNKKWKKKKNKKKNMSRNFRKNKREVVKVPEGLMKVTGPIMGEVVKASNVTEEVTVCAKVKGFNGSQAIGFTTHNVMGKDKGKEVNLSESSHNVVPVSDVAKGSDEVEEVIGSKIKNGKKKMGKGKMVNIPELSDQTAIDEEAKGVNGSGEVIGSENQSGIEATGRAKNVNVPELSKTGLIGGFGRRRNQAGGVRGRGHPRAGSFTGRAAGHLRGGDLVWVPKRSS